MTGQTGTGIVNPWNTLLGASGTESVCSSHQVTEIPSSQSHSACAAEVVDVAVSFSVTLDVGCHFSHQGQRPCLPQEADCTPPSAALLSCSLLSGRVSSSHSVRQLPQARVPSAPILLPVRGGAVLPGRAPSPAACVLLAQSSAGTDCSPDQHCPCRAALRKGPAISALAPFPARGVVNPAWRGLIHDLVLVHKPSPCRVHFVCKY